jgi:hypothetical protein
MVLTLLSRPWLLSAAARDRRHRCGRAVRSSDDKGELMDRSKDRVRGRTRRLAAAMVGLTLVVVACSDKKDDDAVGADTEESAAPAATSGGAAETTAASAGTTATTAATEETTEGTT